MRPGGAARLKSALPYAVLLCGAAYLFVAAGEFAKAARPGELGPDFWPRAILVVSMLVCAGAALQRLLFVPRAGAETPVHDVAGAVTSADVTSSAVASMEGASGDVDEAPVAPADKPATHPYLLLAGIALSAAYVAGLEWVGFFLATALYLGLFMGLGRYRRAGVIASTSLLGSVAFVFVFMKIVYVSLPLGVGPFRALSVAILAALGVR